MTTLTKRGVIPHGVVFLYDPTMIIDVPEDTGAEPILHTNTCISIWTIQEEEGEVLLTLSDDAASFSGHPVFEAIVETNGRRVAFNDSNVNPILDLAVLAARTKIKLFTNHGRYPDAVTCLVEAYGTRFDGTMHS